MTFEDQVPSCGGLRHQTQWSQSQWCVYWIPPYRQIRIHGLQGNVALKPRLVNQDPSLFVIIVLSAGALTLSVQELKYDSLKYHEVPKTHISMACDTQKHHAERLDIFV